MVHSRPGEKAAKTGMSCSPQAARRTTQALAPVARKTATALSGNRWHTADHPIDTKTVWHACDGAAKRAGLSRAIHPHTLRIALPSHARGGADLRTIQILLGHQSLKETTIYLHLSKRHLSATAEFLLDSLQLKDDHRRKE